MSLLFGITGPSSSGKSTVCRILSERNKQFAYLPTDYFFKTNDELTKVGGVYNRDCPEALKADDLYKALVDLKNNQPTEVPIYKRKLHAIIGTQIVEPKPVVLVDGFMLFHEERVRNILDEKIFIEVPREIQEKRRHERYIAHGLKPDIAYFNNFVYPGYETYVLPTKKYANHVVDGLQSIEDLSNEIEKIINKISV